jgi:23S rRNA pseudouridine1911/1915/1917 synthase
VTDPIVFKASEPDGDNRLDVVVTDHLSGVSRSLVRSLIDGGRVLVNGKVAKASYRAAPGDLIAVELILPPSLRAEPESIPLSIVYRDEDLAVLDKPAGLVVHPAAGHQTGTLANALVAMFPQTRSVGAEVRPGIVHRLDKDTSGLMVVALTPAAQASLQRQIAERSAGRWYVALATGRVTPERGVIDAPIGRDPADRKRMAVHGIAARPATTSYQVLDYAAGFTLLEARLQTGRTHQIRVHLAALGHPIAGDPVYRGAPLERLERQFLHAYRLTLRSPSSGRPLRFTSPLPPDLRAVLARLGMQWEPSEQEA